MGTPVHMSSRPADTLPSEDATAPVAPALDHVLRRTGGLTIGVSPSTRPGFVCLSNHTGSFPGPHVWISLDDVPDLLAFWSRRDAGTGRADEHTYRVGRVDHACPGCGWAANDRRQDLAACPQCRASLAAPHYIEFSGVGVVVWSRGLRVIHPGDDSYDGGVKLFAADRTEIVDALTGLIAFDTRNRTSSTRRAVGRPIRVNANVFFMPAAVALVLCLVIPWSPIVQRLAAVATSFACVGLFLYGWRSYLRFSRMILPPLLLILALTLNPIAPVPSAFESEGVPALWCAASAVAVLILTTAWLNVREYEAKTRINRI